MARSTWLAFLGLLIVFAGCSGDDDDDSAGAGAGSAGKGASSGSAANDAGSSGGKAGNGSAGSGTQTGSSGTSSSAGTGAGGSGQEDPVCDLDCADNEHCELMEVTCIRAPCNPIPTCVAGGDDAGSGGDDAGSSAGSGVACGTRGTGDACGDDEYCDFPPGADCGRSDAGGTCKPRGSICTREYQPVCGCDGMTYGNACSAAAAGVSVETDGECEGASAGDSVRCNDAVTCPAEVAACPEGQVRRIVDGCYGDCVAIDLCECAGPDDCPEHDTYTCHMSAQHCGPYV